MTTIIILSLIVAVSYFYLKEMAKIDRFRKNIHQGDTVTCHLGQNIFRATVQKIPGADRVIVSDLTCNSYHTVSIHSIYPL